MLLRTYELSIIEERRQFLEDNWLHLASFAYKNYVENGMGAVLVSGSAEIEDMMYVAQAQLSGYPDILKTVQDYNPEISIVIIFALSGGIVVQSFHGEPPPPDALRVKVKVLRKQSMT